MQRPSTADGLCIFRLSPTAVSYPSTMKLDARSAIAPTILSAVAASLFFLHLGRGALRDWDEAIYAEVSREMLLTRDWLTPHWQYLPFFEKPPLLFWIQSSVFRLFGVTEFWARFPAAIAGVFVVLLTFLLTRRLAGSFAALLAALALLTTRDFVNLTRQGMMATPLTLCVLAALYAWVRVREGSPRWLYGVALAVAAGAMLKGPAILVAPFAIAVDAFFWRKALSGIRARHWTGALAVTLLVVGPWHMAILAAHGGAFFREYFIQQIVHRTDSVIDASTGGPLYYAVALVHGAFPWSIFAAFSVARLFWLRKRLPAGSKQLRTQSVDPLFWSLIAVTLVLYTLVSTKHAWYIAPVFPALAIESGRLLAELLPRHQRLRLGVAAVLAFALVFTFARVAVRQGDHFSNEIAQMAMLTRTAESHSASPLLVLAGAGENPQADVPTVVFYSHRTATSIVLPQSTESLAIALASNGGREAILSNETIPALSNCCTIHAFAHNELFTYARISLTYTSKRP